MICNATTWVPYFNPVATGCHQLRALYHQHNLGDLGGRNCATIWYRRVANGNLCHVSCSSESGVGAARHSERVCQDELLAREGWTVVQAAAQIICVYTERFPCGPQMHNCFNFLNGWLAAQTPVFWSFEYPDAKDIDDPSDDDGAATQGRKAEKAKQLRAQGTKDLKDYQRDIDYASATGAQNVRVQHGAVSDPVMEKLLLGLSGQGPALAGSSKSLSRRLPSALVQVGDSPWS